MKSLKQEERVVVGCWTKSFREDDSIKKKIIVKKCNFSENCCKLTSINAQISLFESKCPYFVEWEEKSYNNLEEIKHDKKNRNIKIKCKLPNSIDFME